MLTCAHAIAHIKWRRLYELPSCNQIDIKVVISIKYGWNTIVSMKIRHLGHFFQNLLCQSPLRLILENKGMHVVYITQKGQTSPVKGHSCGFLPLIFSNLGYNAKPPK